MYLSMYLSTNFFYLSIYVYIYVCVCVCIYIYIYIYISSNFSQLVLSYQTRACSKTAGKVSLLPARKAASKAASKAVKPRVKSSFLCVQRSSRDGCGKRRGVCSPPFLKCGVCRTRPCGVCRTRPCRKCGVCRTRPCRISKRGGRKASVT
jgi:hypothetical protein